MQHKVRVYTASARDYGRCVGLDCVPPETFGNAEETEVPQLAIDVCKSVLARRAREKSRLMESIACFAFVCLHPNPRHPNPATLPSHPTRVSPPPNPKQAGAARGILV